MAELGFGCMRLPRIETEQGRIIDEGLFEQMVDHYLQSGFRYFDTAYKYCGGLSEPALRKALVDRYPRDAYILTTKLSSEFMHTKKEQDEVFAEQFERLGVEYFDYYLLHNVGAVNYKTALELDSFSVLKRAKDEGKAKHIGMSFHDNAALLDQILTDHPEVEVVQLQLNYLDWDNESIQSRKCWEVARKHKKPVFVMEPLKGGALAKLPEEAQKILDAVAPGRSPASWALRFAASHEGVERVLSGMNRLEQLEDNLSAMQPFVPLSEQELEAVRQAAEVIRKSIAVPCTGCRYCTETCPKNIPIPDYFSLLQPGYESTQMVYYYNYSQGKGRAGDCIGCRQCERHCPQHIEIPKYLKEVSEKFDSFRGYR